MHNEIITISNITIYGYGVMMAIGIIVANIGILKMVKKKNIPENHIINIVIIAMVFGILGAKLLYCIINFQRFIKNPMLMIANGGFVVYGGIILGTLICFIYCRKARIDFFTYADIILPHLFIAQAFGRIGCFLAGCCYGMEYDGIGYITFKTSQLAPNYISLFPTQLCSSTFDMLMGIILIALLYKKNMTKGIITSIYLLSYGIGRFLIEFVRGDIERGMILGISTSQFISIFIIFIGIFILILKRRETNAIFHS